MQNKCPSFTLSWWFLRVSGLRCSDLRTKIAQTTGSKEMLKLAIAILLQLLVLPCAFGLTCYTFSTARATPPIQSSKNGTGFVCAHYCNSCVIGGSQACSSRGVGEVGCCQPGTYFGVYAMVSLKTVSRMKAAPNVYLGLKTCNSKNLCNWGPGPNCGAFSLKQKQRLPSPAPTLPPKSKPTLSCYTGSTGRGIQITPMPAPGSSANYSCVSYCHTCVSGEPGTCAQSGMVGCCHAGYSETVYGSMNKQTLATSRSNPTLSSCDTDNCNVIGPKNCSPTTKTTSKPTPRGDFYYSETE